MGELTILKSGMASIQDLGRHGYARYGVPRCGAMDSISMQRANALLENPPLEACLEITLMGLQLEFSAATQIAITGAVFDMELSGKSFNPNEVVRVKPGNILKFGRLLHGCRAYVAIEGGFKTELVLGSRSMYSGVTKTNRLGKGDRLPYGDISNGNTEGMNSKITWEEHTLNRDIPVLAGPEFGDLPPKAQAILFEKQFSLSKNMDRMGIQLTEILPNKLKGLTTGPVVPGTVQLTPSGKLVVLMRDAQTTGGYPRILQLTEFGICSMAQKKQGDTIKFVKSGNFDLGIPVRL